MKTLKILSIGNSFTQDPLRYLHDMGKARGVNIKCVNLVIGGCSLERHYRNMLSQKDAYSLEINGESIGFTTDLRMALASDMFDIVTIQQASHFSHMPETYYPYIEKLAEYGFELSLANTDMSGGASGKSDRYVTLIHESGIKIVISNNHTKYLWVYFCDLQTPKQ